MHKRATEGHRPRSLWCGNARITPCMTNTSFPKRPLRCQAEITKPLDGEIRLTKVKYSLFIFLWKGGAAQPVSYFVFLDVGLFDVLLHIFVASYFFSRTISLLFSLLLWPFSAVPLTPRPVFGSRRKQDCLLVNHPFDPIVWRQPSPGSARNFWNNFRLWRRNYNINVARRMDMIRMI